MLDERGLKAALAVDLNVGPDRLSKWLSGAERPMLKVAVQIEGLLGLSPRLWEDEPPTDAGIAAAIGEAESKVSGGVAALRKRAEGRREDAKGAA